MPETATGGGTIPKGARNGAMMLSAVPSGMARAPGRLWARLKESAPEEET